MQRVQEVQEFANNGGGTITDKDILDTIYTLLYNTGLLYDNCDKLDDRQRDGKTLAKFQAHFQAAQRKYKREQKLSTRAGGYHRANNLREMDGTHDDLIDPTTEAADERETMISQ